MDKLRILEELRRTAAANGGAALGRQRFEAETGIKESDWQGRFWARWSDAVAEAGLAPNQLATRLDESSILAKVAALTRRLGRIPTQPELRLERRSDSSFPSHGAIDRLGGKSQLIAQLRAFCAKEDGYSDVLAILPQEVAEPSREPAANKTTDAEDGDVYLLQSGRHYKLGRTNAFGRREREIALQLPEKAKTIHVIRTDDPVGIEAYWHQRFAASRRNGEWFELTSDQVRAFKRRKFM